MRARAAVHVQVPLVKILGSSRDGFSALRHMVDRERQHVAVRLELLNRGEALTEDEVAMLSAQDPAPLLSAPLSPFGKFAGGHVTRHLLSSCLRSDLQLVHSMESEVDTDVDDGGEVTDIDEYDFGAGWRSGTRSLCVKI
jgi:hypothetical protein